VRTIVLLAGVVGAVFWWRRRQAAIAEDALWNAAGEAPVRDLR